MKLRPACDHGPMTAEQTVLIVEDDHAIADLLEMYLRGAGFRVRHAGDGERALAISEQSPAALVVLDVGLPGIDGFEVCRRLRARTDTPVLFLTARDDEIDRLLGLELGADDYVIKPFSPREVVARVKAILRRGTSRDLDQQAVFEPGDGIRVDADRREVSVGGEVVSLTAKEFDLLSHLARNHGRVLSRRQLLDSVWEPGWIGDERTVDVHVAQLRKKLGDDLPLATMWGIGYRLG